jgi:hypothetical protein
MQRAAEPQGLNLQACGLYPDIQIDRFGALITLHVELDQEPVRLVQRVRHIGKPSRSLHRRHLGWYAIHLFPGVDSTLYAMLITVPCFLLRSGAEIV